VITIQKYVLKRGVSKDIERVKSVFVECFDGVEPKSINGRYTAGFEALDAINFWFEDGEMCIDTTPCPNPSDDEILNTNKRFRKFLEQATGYTAKQRVNKAKKRVSK